jgi:hypothetical protein
MRSRIVGEVIAEFLREVEACAQLPEPVPARLKGLAEADKLADESAFLGALGGDESSDGSAKED